MPRLPRITGKEMIRILSKNGFKIVHTKGSHYYLEPFDGGQLVTVPVHSGKILKPKTLKSILKQADLDINDL